jgi:hypothetical protein
MTTTRIPDKVVKRKLPPQDDTARYYTVEKLIYHTVHKFIARYGGSFEDYLPDAQLAYCALEGDWAPSRAGYSTYVSLIVWYGLLNGLRERMKAKERFPGDENDELSNILDRHHFDLPTFREELSEDAQALLDMVFHCPLDVLCYARRGKSSENKPQTLRKAVVEFLRELGWTENYIAKIFAEIQEALP